MSKPEYYRRRAKNVSAIQFTGEEESLAAPLSKMSVGQDIAPDGHAYLNLSKKHSILISAGDWIVRHPEHGYLCYQDELFHELYELAE